MRPEQFIPFLGLAAIYAALTTATIYGLARIVARPGGRAAPLVYFSLFFFFLTQHPFPDPATMTCPRPFVEPQMQPFLFLRSFSEMWEKGGGFGEWTRNRIVAASTMNFALLGLVGVALRFATARWIAALIFAPCLSLAAELTQLTAFWGLWPCPFRQFNVDDLILNVSGLWLGFALASLLAPRFSFPASASSRRAPPPPSSGRGGRRK